MASDKEPRSGLAQHHPRPSRLSSPTPSRPHRLQVNLVCCALTAASMITASCSRPVMSTSFKALPSFSISPPTTRIEGTDGRLLRRRRWEGGRCASPQTITHLDVPLHARLFTIRSTPPSSYHGPTSRLFTPRNSPSSSTPHSPSYTSPPSHCPQSLPMCCLRGSSAPGSRLAEQLVMQSVAASRAGKEAAAGYELGLMLPA